MTRTGLVRLAGAVLIGCAAAVAFAAAPVGASDGEDDRARVFDGNIQDGDCAKADLEGEAVTVEATNDGTFVTITGIPDGITLTGVVVKGGDRANIYDAPSDWTNLRSPLNKGGQIPAISHWFACGIEGTGSTPSEVPTSPGETPTSPGDNGSDSPSATPSPAGPGGNGTDVSNGANDRDLAETGFNSMAGLGIGLFLLAAGAFLLVAPRRFAWAVGRHR